MLRPKISAASIASGFILTRSTTLGWKPGCSRCRSPSEYGGLGGNVLDLAIVSEEIGRYSADVAMAFGGSIFCALNVARKGSEEQKRHWLPKLISGEIRMSISMSEPDAGSDVGAMRTQARRDGNEYVISGQKIWATGAGAKNNFINVYVKTDPKAHYRQGMSLFLVDNTTPGLEIRKLDMLGRRSVGTYELNFNDARIPPDRLIGGENKGWECILSGLTGGTRGRRGLRLRQRARRARSCGRLRQGSAAVRPRHRHISRRSPTCSPTWKRKSKPRGR